MELRDLDAALRRLAAGEPGDVEGTLRALRDGVDASLAVPVVLQLMALSCYRLERSCQRLPISVIRAVLAASATGPKHLFLRLAVPAEGEWNQIARSWRRALRVLCDLDLDAEWGSRAMRGAVRSIAADPQLLHAIQGTAAHAPDVEPVWLAVLAADGSDASLDALVPHVEAALAHRDRRLDHLVRLREIAARRPALDTLLAELEAAFSARNAASPALALGPLIGLGRLPELRITASTYSREVTSGSVPRIQAHIGIDSRRAAWFSVLVSEIPSGDEVMRRTSFDAAELHFDDLELGRCEAAQLPAWLAGVAARLAIAWQEPRVHADTDPGDPQRTLIVRWLASGGDLSGRTSS